MITTKDEALVQAKASKAAWDAGDFAAAAALIGDVRAWAATVNGTIDQTSIGELQLTVDGASELLA